MVESQPFSEIPKWSFTNPLVLRGAAAGIKLTWPFGSQRERTYGVERPVLALCPHFARTLPALCPHLLALCYHTASSECDQLGHVPPCVGGLVCVSPVFFQNTRPNKR